MNIRTATLKAADSIEQNPDNYLFMSNQKPDCGTPGCALGWVGFHLGVAENENGCSLYHLVVADVLGFIAPPDTFVYADRPFYGRMDDINNSIEWRHSAKKCAAALRLYADKYHPADNQGMPDVVRSWFDEKAVA